MVPEADLADARADAASWRRVAERLEREKVEALTALEEMRAELASAEPILVAADRLHEACEAVLNGRDPGRLPDWERSGPSREQGLTKTPENSDAPKET